MAKPAAGANLDEVKRMLDESGAFVFGRRTYEITHGRGHHPSTAHRYSC
jgi:hypothetical protein